MNEILTNYTNWLKVNGLSSSTIKTYAKTIEKLFTFSNSETITEQLVINFLAHKQTKGDQPSTINIYRMAISSFCKFQKINIELPKSSKVIRKLPEYLTEKEFVEQIIPMCDYLFKNSIKVKAILYFMFYTGVRKSELYSLHRKDIDLVERKAVICSHKTKREKIVFFTPAVATVLKQYFSCEAEEINALNINLNIIEYIFQALRPNFKRLNLHAHLFRHSFAVCMILRGVDVSVVSKLLGHSSIAMTMIYAELNTKSLQDVYRKSMDRKGKL